MRQATRIRLLRTCGVLLIALGLLHIAATAPLLQFYRTMVPAQAWTLLEGPTALNHLLVGVLLLPLGYSMWLAAHSLPAPWARRICIANSLAIAALPVLLIALMRDRQYMTAPPFMAAVALTFLIAAITLFAAFGGRNETSSDAER